MMLWEYGNVPPIIVERLLSVSQGAAWNVQKWLEMDIYNSIIQSLPTPGNAPS